MSTSLSDVFGQLTSIFDSGGTGVGLSIGSASVKMAIVKKNGKRWKLSFFGMVGLPADSVVDREIVNTSAVIDAIKTVANQAKLRKKNICTSLSGSSLVIKRMQLDVPNIRELQDNVFWEAEQYLPFDVSEVVMDYHLIAKNPSNQVDVLLVAVKRAVLDGYMNCVAQSELVPSIVNTDFFALLDVFEANYPVSNTEATAIIDFGATALKTMVASAGVPLFTKDVAMGGKNLTEEIQKNLRLEFNDAETLKTSGAADGNIPQEVSELMNLMVENYVMEIKKNLEFYNASSFGPPVSSVLLSGGASRIPSLSRVIEEQVGIPTQILNPFNAIGYDPSVFSPEYLNQIAQLGAVPIGLALRAASG
jgi:type IV pilus assembly protein PilM